MHALVGISLGLILSLGGIFLVTEWRRALGWIEWKWKQNFPQEMPPAIRALIKWQMIIFGLVGMLALFVDAYFVTHGEGRDDAVLLWIIGAVTTASGFVMLVQRGLMVTMAKAMVPPDSSQPKAVHTVMSFLGWAMAIVGHAFLVASLS